MPLVPLLLVVHVLLALGLLLPSILLPFVLRATRLANPPVRPIVHALLVLQARGTLLVGLGLALSGLGLLVVLGVGLIARPWLLVAVTIYATNLLVAFFIQRPNLRRLVGARAAWDDRAWEVRARRQRYVSYGMAGLTGTIGLLMSAKPDLW